MTSEKLATLAASPEAADLASYMELIGDACKLADGLNPQQLVDSTELADLAELIEEIETVHPEFIDQHYQKGQAENPATLRIV